MRDSIRRQLAEAELQRARRMGQGDAHGVSPADFKHFIRGEKNAGRSIVIPADDRLVTVLELSGDDEVSQVVTVTLDAALAGSLSASTDFFAARAVVRWGVGGVSHQAEIDVNIGTVLSVPASWLRVDAANEGSGPNLTVFASATYGSRGGPSNTQRTRRISAIAAAGTSTILVPDFATAVTIYRSPRTAPYTFAFIRQQDVATDFGTVDVLANENPPQHMPIPGDTDAILLTNGATALTAARVIFDLAL